MAETPKQVVSMLHVDSANLTNGQARALAAPIGSPQMFDADEPALKNAIEADVVPRLLMSHRGETKPTAVVASSSPLPAGIDLDVTTFADLVLDRNPARPAEFAQALIERNVPTDVLYLDLLAPTARYLGDLWLGDLRSFADVTLGIWRLQQLMRDFAPLFHRDGGRVDFNRNILLMPMPDDQHTFGVLMAAEFFRRSRWNVVYRLPSILNDDTMALVRNEWFNVIGVSLSCERRLDELASFVRRLRRASRNKAVGIMVGGPVFAEHPELVAQVGADLCAGDGREAPQRAESFAALRPDLSS